MSMTWAGLVFRVLCEKKKEATAPINVNGVVTDEIIQDLLSPAIQDSVDNKDVILFRSDSRQALELTS